MNFPGTRQVRHYYANSAASSAAKAGKPLPDCSVLLVEVHSARLDADRNPMTGSDGFFIADQLLFYTAMARNPGWGSEVPDMLRNDDWNYAVFTSAKQHRPGINQAECLACHKPHDKTSYAFTLNQLAGAAKQRLYSTVQTNAFSTSLPVFDAANPDTPANPNYTWGYGMLDPAAAVNGAQPVANYQGMWWNAPANSESGWGINFAHQGDTIFATWFTYGLDGFPLWLVVGATKTGANVYSGALFVVNGPAYNAPFDPSEVAGAPVGTATFTFADGNNATFAYNVNGIAQTKQVARQVFSPPAVASAAAAGWREIAGWQRARQSAIIPARGVRSGRDLDP